MFCEQSDWILDASRVPLLNFAFEKYLLGIPKLGGVLSWLDSLMKFQFSANRANVHVACLNPEIWWFLRNQYLSDWTYF